MSRPKSKPVHERRAAAGRLAHDGPLRPIAELCAACGRNYETVKRWGIRGAAGAYLDVVRDGTGAWLSSLAALERFFAEVERLGATREKRPGGTGRGPKNRGNESLPAATPIREAT